MAARASFVDRELERLVCVSMAHVIDQTSRKVVDLITVDDFDDIENRRVWHAVEALVAERDGWVGGPEVVAKRCGMTMADWHRYADGVEWVTSVDLIRHAEATADLAAYRRLRLIGQTVTKMTDMRAPIDDITTAVVDGVEGVRSVVPERALPPTAVEIMGRDLRYEYDWLVEGWIEVKDRVMITGAEGFGKMTLMRQWAVQLAAGFHPWTGEDVQPLRVLQLDLQDGQVRNEREFRKIMRMSATRPVEHLWAESWKAGVDIVRSQRDRRAVESLIRSTRPHVFMVGPAYKLAKNSARKESETAQAICDFVDLLSNRYDVAVIMEAHSPNAPATGPRVTRPYGGQEFTAWPDAGIGLVKDGDYGAKVREWRGNRDRDEKVWPDRLVWGEEWPWVPRGTSVLALRPRVHARRLPNQSDDDGPPPDDAAPAQEEIF